MAIKVRKQALIHYLLLYLMLMQIGNRIFTMYNNVLLVMVLIITAIFFLTSIRKINPRYIKFLFVFTMMLLMTSVFTNFDLQISSVLSIVSRCCMAMVAYYYDKNNFTTRFVKIVAVLSGISLVGFVITQLAPNVLMQHMPLYSYNLDSWGLWGHGVITIDTYYSLIYQFRTGTDIKRNIGMFNEPGLYQIQLTAAIYVLMFRKKTLKVIPKLQKRYFLVILITLITCQSTTGYIGLLILTIGYLFQNNNKHKAAYGLLLFCGLIAFVIFINGANENSFLVKNFTSKLINENNQIDLSSSTGESRIVSIKTDLKIASEYPFGSGTTKYPMLFNQYSGLFGNVIDTSSCVGITAYMALVGIIPTLYVLLFYFKSRWKYKNSICEFIVFLLLFINTSLGQPSIFFPLYIALSIDEYKGNYQFKSGRTATAQRKEEILDLKKQSFNLYKNL